MNDDYLWNKTGHDPEVEALEELLEGLAYRAPAEAPAPFRRPGWRAYLTALATAAALLWAFRWAMRADLPPIVPVAVVVPQVPPVPTPLAPARHIDLGIYGSVNAHEGADVDVLRQSDEEIRLFLKRGTVDARITLAARPRLFQIETPSTTCVDLGCHYSLTVEADGSTLVRVDSGHVAFVDGARETWIPADASCRAFPARGSGTPRWDNAPLAFVAAVELMDRAEPEARHVAAIAVVRACVDDLSALTLWHLRHDRDARVKEAAWTALLGLIGAPEGITEPRAPEAEERWKLRFQWKWTDGVDGRP